MKTILINKRILTLILAAFAFGFLGCEEFTEIGLPDAQLAADAVFEQEATANAAIADIYARIRNNGLLTGLPTGLSHQLGLYTDELQLYVGNQSFFANTVSASDNEILELWNSSYGQIYAANAAIEGLQASVSLSATSRDRLLGEALFLRALIHFYLFNTFGEIPYITTADYRANQSAYRTGATAIYNQLKQDLSLAAALLPESYAVPDRTRANKAAAMALLARVYLYDGEWENAQGAASAVLAMQEFYQLTEVEDTFQKEAAATLLQFSPELSGGNTLEAQTFIFLSGPPPRSALSQGLYEAFPDGDLRKVHWIGTVTDGESVWHYPAKYRYNTNTDVSYEYSILLRLPELYLIRAEARMHLGDLSGSRDDINALRIRAGLQEVDSDIQAELLLAILTERQLELFSEFGHRFFDLKRNGLLNDTLGSSKPGWQPTDALLPLPESELLLNANLLPQNEGY